MWSLQIYCISVPELLTMCHQNIFLAGGLSENPYVRERVKQCAREHGGIEVREAHDGYLHLEFSL